jgi:hypothetical protein
MIHLPRTTHLPNQAQGFGLKAQAPPPEKGKGG